MNSKDKGNRWERDISRKLSMWWSSGKNPNIFVRSASSGAWRTAHKSEGVRGQVGDIAAVDQEGQSFTDKVCIEVKFYKEEESILFESILQKRMQILKWWQKCEDEALDTRKMPWLIVKFNRKPPFIILPKEGYENIVDSIGMPEKLKTVLFMKLHFDESVFNTIIFLKLDDFLQWCKAEIWK